MAIDITTRNTNLPVLEKAVRHRAKDFSNELTSKLEEDTRVNAFLKRSAYHYQPGFAINQPMSSHQAREFLRDTRFFVVLNNLELAELEQQIGQFNHKSLNRIHKLQKDVEALDSATFEQELRFYKHYDQVHYNSFAREKDMPITDSLQWSEDYKTELAFDKNQQLSVFPGAGLTLPIGDRFRIPIVDATIVGEASDVGDTVSKIVNSDPRNLFISGEVFRYIVIRREHDETTRKYNRNTSYLTLLLELPGIQLINWLQFVPAASSAVLIDSISYINESNEEVALTSVNVEGSTGVTFLFEPVRARYIKLQLVQHAPVTKLGMDYFNLETRALNKILNGLSWHTEFDESSEYIEGRVFDFSVRDIQVGLNHYFNSGVFRSKPVKVKNIASATVADIVDTLPITSTVMGSAILQALPDESAYTEYYLGVDIHGRNGRRLIKDFVPVPDTYPGQVEYLPLIGDSSRLKLLPDLLWNLQSKRIVSASAVGNHKLSLVTELPHGLSLDESIGFTGPANHPLVGLFTVKQITDDFTFLVHTIDLASVYTVDLNTSPQVMVYKNDIVFNDVTYPPLRVFEDGIELFIGERYLLNFGTSTIWLDSFPRGIDLSDILTDPRSGRCHVQVINPNYASTYWVEYRPYPNQWLGKTKLVKLKNGRVVFDPQFKHSNGTISTVVVLRGDFTNPYVSPVIRNYSLRIREY